MLCCFFLFLLFFFLFFSLSFVLLSLSLFPFFRSLSFASFFFLFFFIMFLQTTIKYSERIEDALHLHALISLTMTFLSCIGFRAFTFEDWRLMNEEKKEILNPQGRLERKVYSRDGDNMVDGALANAGNQGVRNFKGLVGKTAGEVGLLSGNVAFLVFPYLYHKYNCIYFLQLLRFFLTSLHSHREVFQKPFRRCCAWPSCPLKCLLHRSQRKTKKY